MKILSFFSAIIIGLCLLTLTSCGVREQNGITTESQSDFSEKVNSEETDNTNYLTYTYANFVKRQGTEGNSPYRGFPEDIVYDGGILTVDVETMIAFDDSSITDMDTIVLFFLDGYLQKVSVNESEEAYVNKIVMVNDNSEVVNFKCAPVCFDDTESHMITAMFIPNEVLDLGDNFSVSNTSASVSRSIILNTVYKSETEISTAMISRKIQSGESAEKCIEFDSESSELCFKCFDAGNVLCSLFIDGELYSENGKYIFTSANNSESEISEYRIPIEESQRGKDCFVLFSRNVNDYILTSKSNIFTIL